MLVTAFIMTLLWGIICIQPGETELCDEGFYRYTPINYTTSRCVLCSLCPPGSRVLSRCSNSTDTMCTPCQKGSFSPEWNRAEYCVPCSMCSSRQEKKVCSATSDTVCKPSCTRGYYWDQSASDCLRCSYCPPDAPQERVYECEQHGGSKEYLCAEGATLRSRMKPSYRALTQSYRKLDRLAHEYPTGNDVTGTSQNGLLIGLSVDSDPTMTSPLPVPSTSSQTTHPRSTDLWTGSSATSGHISSPHLTSKASPSTSGKYSPQRSSRSLWSQLTTTDILVLVVVITLCGVLSFVITATTCHFLMKAGVVKPTSATVAVAGGRPSIKGWMELPRYDTHRDLIHPEII